MLDVGYINDGGSSVSGIMSQVNAVAYSASSSTPAAETIQNLDLVMPRIVVETGDTSSSSGYVAVLQYFYTNSGEVKRQYPSPQQIRAILDAQALSEKAIATKAQTSTTVVQTNSSTASDTSTASTDVSTVASFPQVSTQQAASAYQTVSSGAGSGFSSSTSADTSSDTASSSKS